MTDQSDSTATAVPAASSSAAGRAAGQATVGVVGLGLVGTALAHRLAAAGFDVLGYDVRADARAGFASGRAATSLEQLANEAKTVVLAVFDTRDVLQVVEGARATAGDHAGEAGGDAATARGDASNTGGSLLGAPHAIVDCLIDCSTGQPEQLAELAQRLARRGVDLIEAPLSGSSQQIERGEATMLLGGEASAIARQQAVLVALSPRRIPVGGPGMGSRAKLATNLVLGLNRAVLAEGMAFAEALGIEPRQFLELVLATPATSAAAEAKGEMMVRGEFGAAQSRIRQHLKDVDLMLDRAGAAGQPLPLSLCHADLMRAAIAAGDGDLDNAALIRQWRRLGQANGR